VRWEDSNGSHSEEPDIPFLENEESKGNEVTHSFFLFYFFLSWFTNFFVSACFGALAEINIQSNNNNVNSSNSTHGASTNGSIETTTTTTTTTNAYNI
jgi:hypothetical protein